MNMFKELSENMNKSLNEVCENTDSWMKEWNQFKTMREEFNKKKKIESLKKTKLK